MIIAEAPAAGVQRTALYEPTSIHVETRGENAIHSQHYAPLIAHLVHLAVARHYCAPQHTD